MEVKRGRSGSVGDGGFTTPMKETQNRGERMADPRVDDTPYINASLSYFYNRRTREPRWKLPPGATYIPDPSRPAGYRIFALTATCPKGSDADTSPVGSCYEKGAQGDRATERVKGDCSAAGRTSMLGGHGRSSSAERHKVISTEKSTRRGRDGLRSPGKGVTREDGLHSGGKCEERRGFNPSKTSTTQTGGSLISRGKDTRRVKDGEISAGVVIRGDKLMPAKEAWTSPTDHPDSSEKRTASDKGAVIDEREGGPVNRVVESFGLEKSQGKHQSWRGRGRRSRAVCTDPVASHGRIQRGTPSSNSDASEGEDEAQAYPQTSDQFAFVPHTASSASPSNNSSSFCCSTSGIKETAVDGRRQRVGLSPQLEAMDDGARRCSASRGIPFRRTSLSPGDASAAQATDIIGIGARPADVANGAPGALGSGGRTISNASPACGDYPVICTGGNPIDAAVVTTVSAKCEVVTPAWTEAPTTITGADAVEGDFLLYTRSGPWSSSPPSSPLSFAVSPVPHRSFRIIPFPPDDDTVLRCSSKSPQAGRFRQPLESSCTPPDGKASRYREDEMFATSTAATRTEIRNTSAFTDPESPLTPPQDNDVGGKSVGVIIKKISSRRRELEERTVSGPLEDGRVKDAAESDTTRKRSSLRTPDRFRNEKKSVAFGKQVSDPVPDRIGMTESVVGFENGSPCVTVRVEDAEASLTSPVTAAHGIVDSGKSDNSLGAVLEDALQLKSMGIRAFRSSRNESVDADYQCLKAGYSTECSSSSTSLMQNYARCIRVASGGGEASLTLPTPVAAVTSVGGGGRSLLPDRVECMAGATLLTVDEPPSPASGDGKRCYGRAIADARPKAVRNESGINCGTLRNEEDGIASTLPRSVAAKAPGTPPTAILTISRDGDMGATESELATRSTSRFAAAQSQAKENRIELRTGNGGHDGDLEVEEGLPGSSVVRHKVRRQLFSEASEARPMVFCPFCGDGVLASGRLREHLEACYVFARSRGSQTHFEVEAAVRAVSGKGKKPALRAKGSCDEDPCEVAGTYSAEDKIAFHKASIREVASSATVPGDGNKSATDTTLEARGEKHEESFISDDREPSFVSLVQNSLADAKISGDGREMERCEGCGRTFAPGRLHSHAKACRSVFMERRQQYDPKAMRAKGTPLEFFQRPIATAPPNVKVKASTPTGFPPTASNISTVKGKDSSASTAGAQSDRNRSSRFNDRLRNKRASKQLPPVEGSAQCPFCSESVPRVKLSSHLLRCDNLRNTRNNRVAPKAPTKASYYATPSITSSGVSNQSAGGGLECPATTHPKAQVQCPHCLREFSPSTAPTHVAICARVENRPRSASSTRAQSAARERTFGGRLRVEKGDTSGAAVRRPPFY